MRTASIPLWPSEPGAPCGHSKTTGRWAAAQEVRNTHVSQTGALLHIDNIFTIGLPLSAVQLPLLRIALLPTQDQTTTMPGGNPPFGGC
jgi:hypothetical protein